MSALVPEQQWARVRASRTWKVWKLPGHGGEAYPVMREVDNLSGLLPDCAVCSRRTGDPILVDRVGWKLRSGVYFVTVECHGEKETRPIRTPELEGVERILLLPAFRDLSIVVKERAPVSPAWLVSLLLQVLRSARRS